MANINLTSENRKVLQRQKGNSLLRSIDNYVVIDIETTGLDPIYCEIIEIAAVRFIEGTPKESYQSLINPGCEIDTFITELTGISNDMVRHAPPITEVLPDFLNFIGNDIIVGHNVNFDINFIYDNCVWCLNKTFSNDFIDTMRLSRRLFREFQNYKLCTLINEFGIGTDVDHRALSDVIQTGQCYEYMKEYSRINNINLMLFEQYYYNSPRAKDIKATISYFNEDSPIFNRCFVFTGVLDKMQRKDAMQIVVNHGGKCSDTVTRSTNYLVLGNNDYCSMIKDGKSNKQKRAESLKFAGHDIEIISENVFYDMLDE